MIDRINASNSDPILHIMSSVCVCLNILLDSKDVNRVLESEDKLRHMTGKRISISSREALIYNIVEVLNEPDFKLFRESLVNTLNHTDKDTFKIYHDKALKLFLTPYISMVSDLMETLKAFKADFIDQLYFLLDENCKDRYAITSSKSFIENHIIYISANNSQDASAGGTENNHVPSQENAHETIYEHLWGGHAYSQKTPAELELINQRIKLNQVLRSGISNKRGIIFKFKIGESFTLKDTDTVLMEIKTRSGDPDVRLFGALNSIVTAKTSLQCKFESF